MTTINTHVRHNESDFNIGIADRLDRYPASVDIVQTDEGPDQQDWLEPTISRVSAIISSRCYDNLDELRASISEVLQADIPDAEVRQTLCIAINVATTEAKRRSRALDN